MNRNILCKESDGLVNNLQRQLAASKFASEVPVRLKIQPWIGQFRQLASENVLEDKQVVDEELYPR